MGSTAKFESAQDDSTRSTRVAFRRWAVVLNLLLLLVLIGYGAGIAVGDSDAEIAVSGDLFLFAGFYWAPAALGMLLACDQALTERPAFADRRRPSALNPLTALGGCGPIPWVLWWFVVLVLRANVDDALFPPDVAYGSGGMLVRLGLGALLVAACLALGACLGRLFAAPLARRLARSRPGQRTVLVARLILLGTVVCGAVLLAASVMSVDSAVRTGSAGRHLFLDAVVGDPPHEAYPAGALWGARVGLAVLALALPPLPALLRRRAPR